MRGTCLVQDQSVTVSERDRFDSPARRAGLGLAGKSFNGYVFWGLTKPGVRNTLERVEQLFRRYSDAALQLSRDPKQKTSCLERVRKHVEQLQAVAH